METYHDMTQIRFPVERSGAKDREFSGGGIRGDVTGFSAASRSRMIRFMAKIRNQGDMLFLTLTYDDKAWSSGNGYFQRDFEAFRKRFERAHKRWSAIWRVEIKERKSGDLIGLQVPHFHLLVFTDRTGSDAQKESVRSNFVEWGKTAWHEITGSDDYHHLEFGFHCTALRNRKQAYSYVSKYVAKTDDDGIACGRRWGRIGTFDISCGEKNYLSSEEVVALKRLIKKWLKAKVRVPDQDAPQEEVEAWLIRMRKASRFARKFARIRDGDGFAVLGLGDNLREGDGFDFTAGFAQFLIEVKRQSAIANGEQIAWGS